jgi:hypothetical protein
MVSMNVWPTDGADGSVANEAKWRKMARHWEGNGIARGVGGELAPTFAGSNVTVQPGAVWIDGHYAELTGSQVLTVTANGMVVVRFDPVANSAELIYRDAVTVPTTDPVGVWEYVIARMSAGTMLDVRYYARNWAVAWGEVGGASVANLNKGSASAAILTVTHQCVPGRRYVIEIDAKMEANTVPFTHEANIRAGSTLLRLGGVGFFTATGQITFLTARAVFVTYAPTDPIAFNFYHGYVTGTGSMWYRNATLRVTDDGPATTWSSTTSDDEATGKPGPDVDVEDEAPVRKATKRATKRKD